MLRAHLLAVTLLAALGAHCGTTTSAPPATAAPAPETATTYETTAPSTPAGASNSTAQAAADREAPVRLRALGDSFTIGTGSAPDAAFPARLAARWREGRCEVALRNPAVNGFTTQDLLDRELAHARPFAPTHVTLAIGANDLVRGRFADEYRAQVAAIFDALARAGVAASKVVAIPQPDWSKSPAASAFGSPDEIHTQIVNYNAALRAEAEARGARYVDLFPLMEQQAHDGLLARDGLHPNAAAHDAWAAALARALPSPCAR